MRWVWQQHINLKPLLGPSTRPCNLLTQLRVFYIIIHMYMQICAQSVYPLCSLMHDSLPLVVSVSCTCRANKHLQCTCIVSLNRPVGCSHSINVCQLRISSPLYQPHDVLLVAVEGCPHEGGHHGTVSNIHV